MEEDIEILEEMKKDIVYDSDEDYDNQIAIRQMQAIENLIKGYREERGLRIHYENRLDNMEQLYIDKDKIKEKIEELDKEHKEYIQEWEIKDEIQAQIDVLQELMEDK